MYLSPRLMNDGLRCARDVASLVCTAPNVRLSHTCTRHLIPAATKWDTWHQLSVLEEAASAAQARRRWPAEAIFASVLRAPSLQGKIPFYFLKHVDNAFLVSCFDTLLCDFNTEPIAWAECKAVAGTGGLDEYPQLHLLMYLINKHCGEDSSAAEAEDAGVQGGAPAELSVANAAAAAAALVAAAASSDVSVDGDSARLCPFEDTAVTDDNDGVDRGARCSSDERLIY